MNNDFKNYWQNILTFLFSSIAVGCLLTCEAAAQTFNNPTAVTIPDSGAASLYPASIVAFGMSGTIPNAPGSVKIRINGFSHANPDDVDMVLVGPTGAALLLQSDLGGDANAQNITYTISDATGLRFADATGIIDGGVYKPGNFSGLGNDNFPSPGPGISFSNPGPQNNGVATISSVFGGTDPNGVWRLYIVDDTIGNTGSIAGGWSLTFGAGDTDLFAPSKLSFGAGDETNFDAFGNSVAVSGDTAIVGAPSDDANGITNQGAAYIFVRDANGFWTPQQKLVPPGGAENDFAGYSVAISGDTAVVGVSLDNISANNDQGSVDVFVRNGSVWTFQQELTASDGAAFDFFGDSVAISGNTIIVGARGDDIGANNQQGSAYVFIRSGTIWTLQQKLLDPDGAAGDFFGASVAISGNTAIVGANQDDFGFAVNQGSASVFTRSGTTWSFQQKLTASDAAQNDFFGGSLDVSDDGTSGFRVIIGADGDDVGANANQGSAYVFRRPFFSTVWTEEQKLTASDGESGDEFGISVALNQSTAVIGSHRDSVGSNSLQGSAYISKRIGATLSIPQRLTTFDGDADDRFGASVALGSNTLFVGANADNINGISGVGSAYIFQLNNKPFDFDGDLKTDISIFRPSDGSWWYLKSSDGGNFATPFGALTDRLTPGDFTGDGKTDIAFWRPSTGEWFVLRSENLSFYSFPFGTSGDIPAPADYDGDGRTDAGIFRPSTATWYIQKSSGGTDIIAFGASGDKPVVADYGGDWKADIAIFRPSGASGAEWWILRSSDQTVFATQFGLSTDKAVPGDYTGDGRADIAFWRPSDGNWFILRSENLSFYAFPFGASGDVPAPGDYDGDGKFDAGVFRSSTANWFVQRSTAGILITTFGANGDRPIPNAFVP
jgi:hypothetical protein